MEMSGDYKNTIKAPWGSNKSLKVLLFGSEMYTYACYIRWEKLE